MSADDFLRDMQQQQFIVTINNELALYHNTGDARFIWRAIVRFHAAGKPLPDAMMAKLADWAGKVQRLVEPADITAALELTGSAKVKIGPKHSAAYRRRWRLGSEVDLMLRLYPERKLQEVLASVARSRGKSLAVVKYAYHSIFTAPLRDAEGAEASEAAARPRRYPR